MAKTTVRPANTDDAAFVLALNETNVEVLAPMDDEAYLRALHTSEMLDVVEVDGEPAAFIIAYREGADYGSENYRWFAGRHRSFLYIDRIVVDERFRRRGIGRELYRRVVERARGSDVPVVCAEIDTAPVYNGTSLAFHAGMGFAEVGTQSVRGGTVEVSLQELRVG